MAVSVQIIDQSTLGVENSRRSLDVAAERMTLRELIRERVRLEVAAFNEHRPDVYHGLVQPEESEQLLNGYRLRARKPLDWQQQFAAAVRAFERQGFFVLVGDQAVASLDDEIELRPGEEVRFLLLVPLMGG